MASGHPIDRFGRVLPDSAWPVDRAAPADLDVIRRFCNTRNCESGADRFETTAGLERWLREQDLATGTATESDRARIVAFRDQLRRHARAHHDGSARRAPIEELVAHLVGIRLGIGLLDGRLVAQPGGDGVVGETLGAVALAVAAAQRDGHWNRFKACGGCDWVFYDRSRNRSGRWCSMNACGGRAKVAAFRARAASRPS